MLGRRSDENIGKSVPATPGTRPSGSLPPCSCLDRLAGTRLVESGSGGVGYGGVTNSRSCCLANCSSPLEVTKFFFSSLRVGWETFLRGGWETSLGGGCETFLRGGCETSLGGGWETSPRVGETGRIGNPGADDQLSSLPLTISLLFPLGSNLLRKDIFLCPLVLFFCRKMSSFWVGGFSSSFV